MDTQTAAELTIFQAADQGNLKRVEFLIETGIASINATDTTPLEFAPLHYAARGGHKEVIKFLLSKGPILDIKNRNNGTPLTVAITNGHADITQLLLEKGADPHNRFYALGNLIHIAAKTGCSTIINQLLQYGALADSQEHCQRYTPLHTAVQERQPRSILTLYPRVDATLRDEFDLTPIEKLIVWISQEDLSKENPRLMQCLYAFLWAGADINEKLISQTVEEERLPDVISIIQEAIQDVKVLNILPPPVINEFFSPSSSKHKSFLKGIREIRSSLPPELLHQIALDRLIESDNSDALDSQIEQNYSFRK